MTQAQTTNRSNLWPESQTLCTWHFQGKMLLLSLYPSSVFTVAVIILSIAVNLSELLFVLIEKGH